MKQNEEERAKLRRNQRAREGAGHNLKEQQNDTKCAKTEKNEANKREVYKTRNDKTTRQRIAQPEKEQNKTRNSNTTPESV